VGPARSVNSVRGIAGSHHCLNVTIRSGVTRAIGTYPELLLVLAGAVVGLSAGRPLRWVGGRQGINVLLAILVFATAVTVSTDSLRRLASSWRQLAAALAMGVTVLPAISWLSSRIVAAGSLRDGIMVIGIAPCEIASVATTALAGGEAALAAAVLIGSTALSVALAGVILALEANQAHVHPLHILVNLVIVVALPLTAGLVVGARARLSEPNKASATTTATAALVGLVALVAAQVHIGAAYGAVLIAIVVIVAVSALLGSALGRNTTKGQAIPLLLTISMRDFAIAAGLASAAFGPSAAAPLGLYGVVVILWGTAVAGRLRARQT
jgi:predicted Na+-dependent transporter